MSTIDLRHARTFSLAASGITFAVIGLLALVWPVRVSHEYAFVLDGTSGLNEFRAIYTGFWLSLGVAMITAARRPDVPLLGDICGVMLLFQALGRLVSFTLDGMPRAPFIAAFFLELSGAVTILALKKRAAAHAASFTVRTA